MQKTSEDCFKKEFVKFTVIGVDAEKNIKDVYSGVLPSVKVLKLIKDWDLKIIYGLVPYVQIDNFYDFFDVLAEIERF